MVFMPFVMYSVIDVIAITYDFIISMKVSGEEMNAISVNSKNSIYQKFKCSKVTGISATGTMNFLLKVCVI